MQWTKTLTNIVCIHWDTVYTVQIYLYTYIILASQIEIYPVMPAVLKKLLWKKAVFVDWRKKLHFNTTQDAGQLLH